MNIARLQSELQTCEEKGKRELLEIKDICSLELCGDPASDILSMSATIVRAKAFIRKINSTSSTIELHGNFVRAIARAPMVQHNTEEDFV